MFISTHADHWTCDHDNRKQLCDRQKLWGGHDRGVSSCQSEYIWSYELICVKHEWKLCKFSSSFASVLMPSKRWQPAVRSQSLKICCRIWPSTRPTKTRVSDSKSVFLVAVLLSQFWMQDLRVCMYVHSQNYMSLSIFASDVMMSARGLIQLFRNLNPQMLHKKDRVSSPVISVWT